jgi:predicted flap endonuclease-1-like 5' DNA nuclease
MASIDTIEGIGPAYAKKLRAAGIRSCEALLKRGASKKGRNEVADATGFAAATILEWVNRADLMRVKGVGSEYSDLLEAAGVDTVKELRRRSAANLTAKMIEVNDAAIKKTKKSIVRQVPAQSMVERWVAHAKTLPPVVTH